MSLTFYSPPSRSSTSNALVAAGTLSAAGNTNLTAYAGNNSAIVALGTGSGAYTATLTLLHGGQVGDVFRVFFTFGTSTNPRVQVLDAGTRSALTDYQATGNSETLLTEFTFTPSGWVSSSPSDLGTYNAAGVAITGGTIAGVTVSGSVAGFTSGTLAGVTISGSVAGFTSGTLAGITAVGVSKTITAALTDGAQTINKVAGQVNFAASGTTLVVTNSLVTANSIVLAQVLGTDATATSVRVTKASGSFTLTLNAAATAETAVSFLVIN